MFQRTTIEASVITALAACVKHAEDTERAIALNVDVEYDRDNDNYVGVVTFEGLKRASVTQEYLIATNGYSQNSGSGEEVTTEGGAVA